MFKRFQQFDRRFVAQFNTPPGDAGDGEKGGTGGADAATTIAALQAENAALKAASSKASPKAGEEGDDDLAQKARIKREISDKDNARTKNIENALKFSLKSGEFLKQNESLLPKEAADIFAQAEKENFADAIEKDCAIKSCLIQSFFSVQANVDLLTTSQKSTLDDYLKLTKNGKQEKAQQFYDVVFEPAFEMLKRIKRAEALSKGFGGNSDAETAYRDRMIKLSKKHYLGEKADA